MGVVVLGLGRLCIGEHHHRAEVVGDAPGRRVEDQRQLAFATGLWGQARLEKTGRGGGVGDDALLGCLTAREHEGEGALRHRLEVG